MQDDANAGDWLFGREIGITKKVAKLTLDELNALITAAGLLGADGNVSPAAQASYSFEKKSSLPTPGVLVKGCLDDCSVCEPNLEQEITLDLKRKELENKLLERQIELLDKSQEYGWCPMQPIYDATNYAGSALSSHTA